MVLLRQGRLDDALACAVEARKAPERQSLVDRHVLGPIEALEASIALAQGDAQAAAAMAAEALRQHTTLPCLTLMILADAQNRTG